MTEKQKNFLKELSFLSSSLCAMQHSINNICQYLLSRDYEPSKEDWDWLHATKELQLDENQFYNFRERSIDEESRKHFAGNRTACPPECPADACLDCPLM